MTTGELIDALQIADPGGTGEVCVNNKDILCVVAEEAYYDGCMERLILDKENPTYNVVGGLVTSEGVKISIHTHSIADAIQLNAELPVEIEVSDPRKKANILADIENHRKEVRKWQMIIPELP